MTATFSFPRLGKLIAKQFFENARLYLFSFIALFGLLALVFCFWWLSSYPRWTEESTYIIYVFGSYLSGSIFASMTFGMLGSKSKGVYWLGIPATHMEKLLCGVFYTTVFFLAAYSICFFLVKTIAVAIVEQYVKTHPASEYRRLTDFNSSFMRGFTAFMYGLVAVQALYLLGSVYFRRFSFILTTIVAAAFIFLFTFYILDIGNRIFQNSASWNFFKVRRFDADMPEGFYEYSLPKALERTLEYATRFIWAPVFWFAAWFRLKEKEI